MKKIYLLLLLFIPVIFSCAYFNTFYNAKYYFGKGTRATKKNISDKLSSEERASYKKAIEKSEKLITLYPKSKYVDDALLIMGESHFYLKQFYKAKERLLKLKEHFPDSKLSFDANLWLGKIAIAEEKYNEAETSLNNLKYSTIPKRLRSSVHSSLGELYLHTGRFKQAIDEYKNALKSGEKEAESDYYFTISACFDSLGEFENAIKYCEKSLKTGQTREVRFQARFNIGVLKKKIGDYNSAIKIFERLLLNDFNKKHAGRLNLEIADCLALKGDVDGAVIALEDITQEFKKKKEAAEAYYRLGEILEKQKMDYDKAAFNYGQVKSQFRASAYADSAEIKKRDILRLQALRQVIKMAVTGEKGEGVSIEKDSTQFEADSLAAIAERDSTLKNGKELDSRNINSEDLSNGMRPPAAEDESSALLRDDEMRKKQAKKKPKRPAENPELSSFKKEELDKNIYLLGELYFTIFSLNDSAVNRFRMLLNKFPKSQYAPKALYVISYINSDIYHDSASADTCYQKLIEDYPATDFANYARKKLGMDVIPTKIDSVKSLFEKAEKILFEKNNAYEAFKIYDDVHKRFPGTEFDAKALYIQGWICETLWDSLRLATSIYDTLLVRYPDSPYSINVKPKIEAVNQAKKQAEAELEKAKRKAEAEAKKTEKSTDNAEIFKNAAVHKDSASVLIKDKTLEKLEKEKEIPESKEKPALKKDESMQTLEKKIKYKELPPQTPNIGKETPFTDSTGVSVKTNAYVVGGIKALNKNISIPDVLKKSVPTIVVAQVFINIKGEPEKIELVGKEENSTLLAVISAAVRKTEFKPAVAMGKPVGSWLTLRIRLKELKIE